MVRARFESVCPGCSVVLKPGDQIATPTGHKNRAGGNDFRGIFYCLPCAEDFQALVNLQHFSGAPFISLGDREAHNARCAPYHASLKDRRQRNVVTT